MKESSTYQAIVEEGRIEEARKLLLRLGSKQLGRPTVRTRTALAKITDLDRLEALIERLRSASSWHALLAEPPAGRS